MTLEQPTPVIALLNLVWEQTNTATAHSWERLNHAMQNALALAIGAGFPFAREDMEYIATHYRFGYWCGASPEWMYTAAVVGNNLSAAQSYEAWKQRKPFVMDNVECARHHSSYMHGGANRRDRDRLTVGATFQWQGSQVTVSSFAEDGQSLIACSYKPQPQGSYETVIAKRFTITHADLKAERAERKERAALIAVLTRVAHEQGSPDALLAALGTTTKAELDRVPLTTLRKVAAQFVATASTSPSGEATQPGEPHAS